MNEQGMLNRTNDHIALWDNLKFLLILLVVVGHFADFFTAESNSFRALFLFIYSFHMPMFFFVSGWFFKSKDNVGHQIIRKIKTLLGPYIVFELILWIVLMPFVPEYGSFRTRLYIFTENTYKIPVENGTFEISPRYLARCGS